MNMNFLIPRRYREGEPGGEGAGGGGGGEGAGAGGGEGAGAGGGEGGAPQRPEYVPENFWNPETGDVNLEGFGKSYSELRAKMDDKNGTMRTEMEAEIRKTLGEEMRGEGTFVKAPEDYTYEVPEGGIEGIPEGVTVTFDETDPMMAWWRETAFAQGLPQEAFEAGINKYAVATMAKMPDSLKIAEELGENGPSRIEAADQWLAANLSKDSYTALASMGNMHGSANFVRAVEELAHIGKGTPLQTFEDDAGRGPLGDADLQAMMEDERYWKTKDPAYIKEVSDKFAKRYNR